MESNNIPWVITFTTQLPWPHVGVCYYTHWNEPVGEKIVHYLMHDYQLKNKLMKWSVSFIHVNLQASQANQRYINHNMNRIRNKSFQSNSYEFARREELLSFFKQIDIVFDIHSTPKFSPCIGVTDTTFLSEAKMFFSTQEIRVDDMQRQWAMIGYFTAQGKPWFGIEAGSHQDKIGYEKWLLNIVNMLAYYGLIRGPLHQVGHEAVYEFLEEIFCHDQSFVYARDFVGMEKVSPWEIVAYEKNRIIKNSYSEDNIYFWLACKKPLVWDGTGFFFRKV